MSEFGSNDYDYDADEERLYEHWRKALKHETHHQLLDRFRRLFVEGVSYPQQPEILATLHRIVKSNSAELRFGYVLNRCCYILINNWSHKTSEAATAELVALLKEQPAIETEMPVVLRLRKLAQQFTQTEPYKVLQKRAWADQAPPKTRSEAKKRQLVELISRYPMLHSHYLLDMDSTEGGQRVVRQRQETQERQFEERLFHYAKQMQHRSKLPYQNSIVENPTFLDDRALEAAIRRFVDIAAESRTFRDSIRKASHANRNQPFYQFKQLILRELTLFVQTAYCEQRQHLGKKTEFNYAEHQLNPWLQKHLKNILSEYDHLKLNESLRAQTSARLLDSLLAHPDTSDHWIFLDLMSNIGATHTVGLMLKIMLFCGDTDLEAIKSHVAKRLAGLFRHYEQGISDDLDWLIDCLENWMVAISIHFSRTTANHRWATLVLPS